MEKVSKDLSQILYKTSITNNRYLTNKSCRNIKKLFNKELSVLDHLFQGYHNDNLTLISSYNDEEKEIDIISKYFSKASYLSIKRAENIINKWLLNNDINLVELNKKLIIYGFEKYKKEKNITYNINISYECYKHFKKLPAIINESELLLIENYLKNMFNNYNPNILNNNFTLMVDITIDMRNGPIEKALFSTLW